MQILKVWGYFGSLKDDFTTCTCFSCLTKRGNLHFMHIVKMPTLVSFFSVLKFCLNTGCGIYNSVYEKELIFLVVPSDEIISLLYQWETKTFFLPQEPVSLLLWYCGKFQLGKVSKISIGEFQKSLGD